MARSLTPRQQDVLTFISDTIAVTGRPPTRAEIARGLGFRSPNAAEDHLKALAKKGVIELEAGTSRGIRLSEDAREAAGLGATPLFGRDLGLPVIGRVAAGVPILAEQHIESRYHVASDLFRQGVDYLLRVHGMSMRDAGILDGDLLAVKAIREATNGQIIVARIGDEVTVKRFRRDGHAVQLFPENPDFQPIEVDLRTQELVIEGLAVGVIRTRI